MLFAEKVVEIIKPVKHLHITFTIPKLLRAYFKRNRKLLKLLPQCANYAVNEYFHRSLGMDEGLYGGIYYVQTQGSFYNYHPHVHALVPSGIEHEGVFHEEKTVATKIIAELFKNQLLNVLVNEGIISEERRGMLLQWNHNSGFNVHSEGKIDGRNIKAIETDEFYSQLMLTDYLQQCEKLEIDHDSHTLFAGIKQYKNRKSRIDGRLLGEQAVFILLSRTRHVQGIPSDIWMNFILECVGDPRSFRAEARFAWQRIGTDLKEWLIGILSQGDIKEFLESISDGQGDEVYKYRRQFWMQFIGHVRYAKLMVCNDNLQHIRRNNLLLYGRFKTQPSVYSQMRRQGERRSFIYMDFGEIKVIEGTKSSKVRLYRQEPVSLEKNSMIVKSSIIIRIQLPS